MPAICEALDAVLNQRNVTSKDVAKLLNVDESTVSRWRSRTEPGRDAVKAIEDHLGLRLGYVSAMAGYVDIPTPEDVVAILEEHPALTEPNRRVVVRVVAGAFEDSRPPRKRKR